MITVRKPFDVTFDVYAQIELGWNVPHVITPFLECRGRGPWTKTELRWATGLDDETVNDLWTSYLVWACSVNPVERSETFREWADRLKDAELRTYAELDFLTMERNHSWHRFPRAKGLSGFDALMEYLTDRNTPYYYIGGAESLYVRYSNANNNCR